ncbi:unnamed protein product [Haemonchus placei]|uniref:Uncharacterized protein n=1 Tax=Haemonchus placei TaxID=6290 RepID=A0A0N4VX21_HAEPC|nr:unnamed protein product [Haemonchus placei]
MDQRKRVGRLVGAQPRQRSNAIILEQSRILGAVKVNCNGLDESLYFSQTKKKRWTRHELLTDGQGNPNEPSYSKPGLLAEPRFA